MYLRESFTKETLMKIAICYYGGNTLVIKITNFPSVNDFDILWTFWEIAWADEMLFYLFPEIEYIRNKGRIALEYRGDVSRVAGSGFLYASVPTSDSCDALNILVKPWSVSHIEMCAISA